MSRVLCSELKLLIGVQLTCQIKRGKLHYDTIPQNKSSLIARCVDLRSVGINEHLLQRPVYPVLFEPVSED